MDPSVTIDALSSNRFGKSVRGLITRLPIYSTLAWLRAIRPAIMLDIGCGKGESIPGFASLRSAGQMRDLQVVGLDIFAPYLRDARDRGVIDDAVLGDARKLPFRIRSFDVSVAVEVIEHLTKEDGEKVLDDLERVSRRAIIVTTPNGYVSQDGYDWEGRQNPYQAHLSGWSSKDLTKRSYKVHGLSGLKIFRKDHGRIRVPGFLGFFFFALAYLSQSIVFFVPRLAFRFVAIKLLSSERKA